MLNESAKLPKVKDSLIEQILLGNKLSPELIAILTIYFVQGILMLSRLAVSFFLKDELKEKIFLSKSHSLTFTFVLILFLTIP